MTVDMEITIAEGDYLLCIVNDDDNEVAVEFQEGFEDAKQALERLADEDLWMRTNRGYKTHWNEVLIRNHNGRKVKKIVLKGRDT